MDKSLENAFSAQTLTGHWKIQSEDYPKEYLGELSYDPRKGIHQLVLYGLCIFPSDDAPQNLTITGAITTGKNASVFNCMIVNAETGSGGILKQKTFFSFLSFCVGEESFPSKDLIRLKKYSFRCTNLEVWAGYRPICYRFSSRKKRTMGTISLPKILPLYEDDVVRIKLETALNQKVSLNSLELLYNHFILIEVKGNRKLPYFGKTNSISYYERFISDFFCLVIGKHAISFHRIGTTKKQRMNIPPDAAKTIPKRNQYISEHVEFFSAYSTFEDSWIRNVPAHRLLIHHSKMNGEMLSNTIKSFFEQYHKFDFVLHDWIAMRNQKLYTNYSLPELLYNFDGLHQSLYPECNTSLGYKSTINNIHLVSPFENYDRLINSRDHELRFRQRLQDILLVKLGSIFQFLTVQQRQTVIGNLVDVRNDAAHRKNEFDLDFRKIVHYIFLCEYLIAIMVLQCIGFRIEQIQDIFQSSGDWRDLKKMLLEEFEGDDDAHE